MPNIKSYDAPALDVRPTEVGIEATAAVGRRGGAFFNQMGQSIGGGVKDLGDAYVEYQDHQEMSRGAKDFSGLIAEKDQLWNDTLKNSDPNDPTVAARFRKEQLEPALEKFKEGFTTQKSQQFAEHLTEQFRTHMVHQTMADMSTQAGIAVRTNAKQTANNLASAVNLNPAMLETSLKTLDMSLDAITASNANLTPAEAAKIKTEFGQEARQGIVKAAVAGMIEKNPNIDLDAIQKKYGEYMKPGEMQQFQKAAKAYQKQDFLFNKQIEKEYLQTQILKGNDALARVKADNMSFDENDKPIIKPGILKQLSDTAKKFTDRNGDPISQVMDHAQTMINTVQAQQRTRHEAVVTDSKTQTELYEGLFRADNPTTDVDIWKASNKDKLDDHATRKLLELQKALTEKPFRGPRYQAAMGAAKEITGADLTVDGHERYAGFINAFIPKYIAFEREGKLPPNALNTKDPESLISQTIKEFELPMAQRMGALALKRAGLPPMNLGGAAQEPAGTKPAMPRVSNKVEFDALPKGTNYTGADGRTYRKP